MVVPHAKQEKRQWQNRADFENVTLYSTVARAVQHDMANSMADEGHQTRHAESVLPTPCLNYTCNPTHTIAVAGDIPDPETPFNQLLSAYARSPNEQEGRHRRVGLSELGIVYLHNTKHCCIYRAIIILN